MDEQVERLAIVETEVKNLKTTVDIGFCDVKKDIKAISDKFDLLDKKYVTRSEFGPVKTVVYAVVGAAGMAVIAGILALVIK